MSLNSLAERYVKLTLAVGKHHDAYIDAYYGPAEWQQTSDKTSLIKLKQDSAKLLEELNSLHVSADEDQRKTFLQIQTRSISTFIDLVNNKDIPFDTESNALYDAVSPNISYIDLDEVLSNLNNLVPGDGSLNTRMNVYNTQFIIPKDKLDIVFQAAINESRERTKKYIDLADNESFTIEYVTDKVWSGYNWYKGNNFSLIQLNTDFPMYISRAIDLAAHEGYPGHHVFNSLMEKHLVNTKGWIEYSVYPLFSPMSLLAEGSANYGIDVVFPKEERIAFEKQHLFPLAGIDADKADLYYKIQDTLQALSYADNVIAKDFLDGNINETEAIQKLMQYTLVEEKKAKQRLGFIQANRAYVLNYNLGQDLVKAYVDKKVQGNDTQETRWAVFTELLSNPKTASMMR